MKWLYFTVLKLDWTVSHVVHIISLIAQINPSNDGKKLWPFMSHYLAHNICMVDVTNLFLWILVPCNFKMYHLKLRHDLGNKVRFRTSIFMMWDLDKVLSEAPRVYPFVDSYDFLTSYDLKDYARGLRSHNRRLTWVWAWIGGSP